MTVVSPTVVNACPVRVVVTGVVDIVVRMRGVAAVVTRLVDVKRPLVDPVIVTTLPAAGSVLLSGERSESLELSLSVSESSWRHVMAGAGVMVLTAGEFFVCVTKKRRAWRGVRVARVVGITRVVLTGVAGTLA